MILGGSNIGCKIVIDFCKSKFNVKLIENNKEKVFEIVDDILDCLVINGDGRNVELFQEEFIIEMDVFIFVIGNSEINIMFCFVVKFKGVKKVIVLVENMDYF